MARAEKRSFVLHYDLEQQTSLLSDEQLGKLLRAIFSYEIRGECPDFEGDQMLLMCFQFVKTALEINREKYIERCEKNAENGKKGGRPPNKDKPESNDETTTYSGSVPIPKSGMGFNGYSG